MIVSVWSSNFVWCTDYSLYELPVETKQATSGGFFLQSRLTVIRLHPPSTIGTAAFRETGKGRCFVLQRKVRSAVVHLRYTGVAPFTDSLTSTRKHRWPYSSLSCWSFGDSGGSPRSAPFCIKHMVWEARAVSHVHSTAHGVLCAYVEVSQQVKVFRVLLENQYNMVTRGEIIIESAGASKAKTCYICATERAWVETEREYERVCRECGGVSSDEVATHREQQTQGDKGLGLTAVRLWSSSSKASRHAIRCLLHRPSVSVGIIEERGLLCCAGEPPRLHTENPTSNSQKP